MPDSIGNKLKAARESRRLTLDEVAESTRIRSVYLQALENDDFSIMLSAAQGRGFLRLYADFLGLNLDELTASARESRPADSTAPEAAAPALSESTPEPAPAPEVKSSRPGFWARLLRRDSPAKPELNPLEEARSSEAEQPGSASLIAEEPPSAPTVPPTEELDTVTPKSAGKKKLKLSNPLKR